MSKVVSPITGAPASPLETVSVRKIVDKYRKAGVDVGGYFRGIDSLTIYRCPDTGYRFFAPPVIGEADFYAELQNLPEYYLSWKWENETAERFIGRGTRLLDVGCGEGQFLEEIRSRKGCVVSGIELNRNAAAEAEKKGVEIHEVSIEQLAGEQAGRFDVVTAFQVLEHVERVRLFLDSAIELLKPGGTLIVGVPNSDPWIFGSEKYCMLNLPPHHAGLWDETSLRKIPEFFRVNLLDVIPELPDNSHLDHYADSYFGTRRENSERAVPRFVYGVLGRTFRIQPFRGLLRARIGRQAASLSGHSIVAAYSKRG